MMTDEKICTCCRARPAIGILSHLLPASFLKYVLGPRNSENGFEIGPMGHYDEYWGRSHKYNTKPEVKDPNFTRRYIFCRECENAFARLESYCARKLAEIPQELDTRLKKKIKVANEKLEYLQYDELEPCAVLLFFYSIMWRGMLLHQITAATAFQSYFEQLRQILLENIFLPLQEIARQGRFNRYPRIVAYTSRFKRPPYYLTTPSLTLRNPSIFFLGQFTAVAWMDNEFVEAGSIEDILPRPLEGETFRFDSHLSFKFPILSSEQWAKPYREWDESNARIAKFIFASKIATRCGLTVEQVEEILSARTLLLMEMTRRTEMSCFMEAYTLTMNGPLFIPQETLEWAKWNKGKLPKNPWDEY